MSLSLAAFSYSSLIDSSCSRSSASFSAMFSRNDRSFMASTSQSCMACFAFSNSSLAYASREMSSSRSLIQFCCDSVARLRSVSISDACASFSCRSFASSSVRVLLCSCSSRFCSSSSATCDSNSSMRACDLSAASTNNCCDTATAAGTDGISLESVTQTCLDRVDPAEQVLVLRLKVLLALVRLVQLLSQASNLLLVVGL